ncbi:hypothetical protein D4R52_03165 [bacterium]|nr:MAG: hypothetical protein D4R52_03165 [bacterium]
MGDHAGLNWFKFFSGFFCGIFFLLFFLTERCASGSAGFFGGLECVIYGILAAGTFFFGLIPTLVGLEHARKIGKGSRYFQTVLVLLLAGFIFALVILFRR